MTISKRLRLAISLAPFLGALALVIPAQAAPTGGSEHHFDGGGRGGDFRGGDFHGRREFGNHFGFGFGYWDPWWGRGWDPVQYWGYPYPYYYPNYYPPYPAYYAPPPPAPVPQAPIQATGAPPQQFWYYCDNPQGYYPYVANCSSSWRQVAPTPPSASGNTITPKAKQ
ncbi:MAG TPA: hypothetical protein VN823_08495 [Stellaceae bacterium]|nr:hypothetical protein [Stellaceae bacterium]